MLATDTWFPDTLASAMGNHLWQSSMVLLAVWLFTLTLRHNRAAVRHALWFTATVKFLVPFSALVLLGQYYGPLVSNVTSSPLTEAIATASQPFTPALPAPNEVVVFETTDGTASGMLVGLLFTLWAVGFVLTLASWASAWLRIARIADAGTPVYTGPLAESVTRIATQLRSPARPSIVLCDAKTEPGIFGIWDPVLLWPRELSDHLTVSEIDAVIAHEICHVRRRDNLMGAVYGFIRATFWFHPALWLVGRALHTERERACDEDVLRAGHAPRTYAESIVKTCEFCLPTPALAAAGVTGSLPTRIVAISRGRVGSMMGSLQRVSLTAAAGAALMVPVVVGMATGLRVRAQEPAVAGASPQFEVASVKPNNSGDPTRLFGGGNGQVTIRNLPAREIIFRAYQTQDYLVVGGPAWLAEERFDIVGKTPPPTTPPTSPLLMVRNLLADRFKLVMHRETRDMPIYNLVLARPDGRGVQPKPANCVQSPLGTPPVPDAQGRLPCGVNRFGPGTVQLTGSTFNALANRLGSLAAVGRTVINRTGLDGPFDFDLTFTPGLDAAPSADGTSVFTALEEQVGARLESARGRVEVLVIDSVERPTPD